MAVNPVNIADKTADALRALERAREVERTLEAAKRAEAAQEALNVTRTVERVEESVETARAAERATDAVEATRTVERADTATDATRIVENATDATRATEKAAKAVDAANSAKPPSLFGQMFNIRAEDMGPLYGRWVGRPLVEYSQDATKPAALRGTARALAEAKRWLLNRYALLGTAGVGHLATDGKSSEIVGAGARAAGEAVFNALEHVTPQLAQYIKEKWPEGAQGIFTVISLPMDATAHALVGSGVVEKDTAERIADFMFRNPLLVAAEMATGKDMDAQTMITLYQEAHAHEGGVDGYLRDKMNLTDEDLAKYKAELAEFQKNAQTLRKENPELFAGEQEFLDNLSRPATETPDADVANAPRPSLTERIRDRAKLTGEELSTAFNDASETLQASGQKLSWQFSLASMGVKILSFLKVFGVGKDWIDGTVEHLQRFALDATKDALVNQGSNLMAATNTQAHNGQTPADREKKRETNMVLGMAMLPQ